MILALAVAAGCAYAAGWPRRLQLYGAAWRWQLRHWQAVAFASGLLLAAGACVAPIDGLVERAFWAQAAQWVVLMTVAAPLLVAGAPAAVARRALPGLRILARPRRGCMGALAGFLPVSAALWLAILPPVEDAVLRSGAARTVEELAFLLLGMLFWAQVIDQRPVRAPLTLLQRAAFLLLASAQQRVLALVLGFAQGPFFEHYLHLSGWSGALVDQQLGAGILLVPGVLTDTLVLALCLFLWLGETEERRERVRGQRAHAFAFPGRGA